ncbi:methionyl-tRNA synthetase [Mycoemilia scoparia]|uniref:Probable methionine--tRNA ligase, mitochondrial n=1 Tax=Mycoemilia scoparia TaxID=417184 RepID=A0A9W7ZVN9_9FUNG|nr:methionyl-tRNA synthetase [Mycoemilia scoparia]
MLASAFHTRLALNPRICINSIVRRQLSATCFKRKSLYVSTPIFYVNSVPHIGHLYSAVIADAIKRYNELLDRSVILSTGTDEHGLKIQQAADKAKMNPLDFCTMHSEKFKEMFKVANISYTDFIRTSERRHYKAVSHFWDILFQKGFIYKGKHSGWYSISDEAFYTDSQIEETIDQKTGKKIMVSKESGQQVEWTEEENYKFKLSLFKDRLIEWIKTTPDVIYPPSRRNEVLSWLQSDITDLSVSRPRSRLTWGIPVPGDPEHTIYVWLDALVNYATVNGYPWSNSLEAKSQEAASNNFPADIHVVGKDIIRFHAVYWPAFLMAAGLPLPKRILAHAHWTMDNMKMSKSRGNVADPFQAFEKFGVDPIRYYLIRNGGLADDGDYSESLIYTHYNKDLAGQLGNLVSRCMARKMGASLSQFSGLGKAQRDDTNVSTHDTDIKSALAALKDDVGRLFDQQELAKGIGKVVNSISKANKYFSDNEPWVLAKSDNAEDKKRLQTVLFYSLEAARISGIMLQPIMPSKAADVLDALCVPSSERSWNYAAFGAGWSSGQTNNSSDSKPLFPRLK